MAKALKLDAGEITIFNVPVILNPVDYSIELMHGLIEEVGYPKAREIIYKGAKYGNHEYCKELRKNTNSKDKELAVLYQQIITLGGYGVAKITEFDSANKTVKVKFENSPVAKRYVSKHGIVNYPVDIITNGFFSGSFNVLFNQNWDSVEIHCVARGDPYCEFIYGPTEKVNKLKDKLWAKWGIDKKK